MIDAIRHDIVDRAPGSLTLATTAADIERAHREGRIAVLIGIEGGHAIEDSLRVLRQFHALGVRYLTPTHVNTNGWADSCADEPKHNGLSPFGRDVIREMNRLGMMVDVSHASDKTLLDVLDTTRAPIIASHSSVAALSNAPRNLKDDLIRKLAANNGVMMINFWCGFVSQRYADAEAARARDHAGEIARIREVELKGDADGAANAIAARWPISRPTVADVADHLDYVKRLLGNVNHLGIGSDFDGISCAPTGLDDVSKLPNLTVELLRRGYTDEEMTKILGGNLLRVMRAVEAAAKPAGRK
jgi:membrane dipeptidase